MGLKAYVTPDKGWAFVVLAGAFLANAICALYATTGVFNVVFLEIFKKDKQTTAWLGAVHSSLISLAGPLSSLITNKYGLRWSYITGSVIAAVGFSLTVFVDSFELVFLTYGIMAGCGLGICYTCAVTTPSYYFEKYRNLSNGVCTTGFGIGIMAFSAIIGPTVEMYGWRGTMLLLAGVSLHGCVSGALAYPSYLVKTKVKENNTNGADCVETEEKETGDVCVSDVQKESIVENGAICKNMYINKSDIKSDEIVENCATVNVSNMRNSYKNEADTSEKLLSSKCSTCVKSSSRESASSSVFDLTIFRNIPYVIFFTAYLLANMGISTSFMFMPVFAIDKGSSMTLSSHLITIIGAINIPSRILTGVITNNKRVNIILTGVVIYLSLGGISFLTPITFFSKVGQIIISVLFGFPASALYVVTPGIVVELVGLKSFTTAIGMASFICGVGFLVAPPLCGYSFDVSGSYEYGFYIAGTSYTLAGLLLIAIYLIHNKQKNRRQSIETRNITI